MAQIIVRWLEDSLKMSSQGYAGLGEENMGQRRSRTSTSIIKERISVDGAGTREDLQLDGFVARTSTHSSAVKNYYKIRVAAFAPSHFSEISRRLL